MRIRRLYDRLCDVTHTPTFHASHSAAHIAYFCAVLAEGHGIYAICGGVMVIYSLVVVITHADEDHPHHGS